MFKLGREILTTIALAVAGLTLLAGSAQATLTFTPPETVFPGPVGFPQMASDPQGRVTIVTTEFGVTPETYAIRVVQLSPAGLPGPVLTLDEVPADPPWGQCPCPYVAVNPSGRATVVWQAVDEAWDRRIAIAQIEPDGTVHPAQLVSPPGFDSDTGKVAMNPQGEATVVWKVPGPESRIETRRIDAEGNLGEIHLLTQPGEGGTLPEPAAGPEGTFHVAWAEGTDPGINTAVLDDEGAPEEIQHVSTDEEGSDPGVPKLVVDSQGRTTIAWLLVGSYDVKAVRLAADGTPGDIHTLSPPGPNTAEPRIGLDQQDRVVVIWENWQEEIVSARIAADGEPEEAQRLSPEGSKGGDPDLAIAPDGRVVVVWAHALRFYIPEESCGQEHLEAENDVVRAAWIGADGQLEGVTDVSPYGQESQQPLVELGAFSLPVISWVPWEGTYFCDGPNAGVRVTRAIEESAEGEPSPPPPPPAEPKGTAKLRLAKRGVARKGRVFVKARCVGDAETACTGAIRLLAPAANLRPASSARDRKQTLALARGRYRLEAGQARVLSLRIPPTLRRQLAAAGTERISARPAGRGLVTKTVLIRVVSASP